MRETETPTSLGQKGAFLSKPIGLVSIFFLVSLMHLYPMFKHFFSMLPYADNGDVSLSLTILYSNLDKLSHWQFNQIYHLPFLYPLSYTTTIGFTLFGQSILFLPFFLLGISNIYPLYNISVIISYVAAGLGAYFLFKEIQEDKTVSIIAACLYILLPFRVYTLPHLNLFFNFPFPFCFYFLLKYLKNPRLPQLFYLNLFLLMQFLFDQSQGFFLSVSLAIFYFIFILVDRKINLKNTLVLFVSLIPTILIIVVTHLPFFQKSISLSPSEPIFNPQLYFPSLSFYTDRSYLMNFTKRIWNAWPFFPGFAVIFFYIFSFRKSVTRVSEKIVLDAMIALYAIPCLLSIILFGKINNPQMNALTDIFLSLFFLSLLLLLILIWKKVDKILKIISLFLLVIILISFFPFPKIFDFFNAVAQVFPFINRSRALRIYYVIPLVSLALFAIGLKKFLDDRKKHKTCSLVLIILVLLGERFRWPIMMNKIPEINQDTKKLYRLTDQYPSHYGLLELPYFSVATNFNSALTRYHHKHIYAGHYYVYSDQLDLNKESGFAIENELTGLRDAPLIEKLKENGLNLILVNRNFLSHALPGDTASLWNNIKKNIKMGKKLGLYKNVEETLTSILLVLDDRRTGKNIDFKFPFYATIGKSRINFLIELNDQDEIDFFFNDIFFDKKKLAKGRFNLSLALPSFRLNSQINHLTIKSQQEMTAENFRLE